MKRGNRGQTSLRLRSRIEDPMREFDRLPAELRAWLASAALPWRPRSVRRAYEKALAETGDRRRALARLTDLQGRLVAQDAARVWGPEHPAAGTPQRCARNAPRPLARRNDGFAGPRAEA
jgi:hypothetical protein